MKYFFVIPILCLFFFACQSEAPAEQEPTETDPNTPLIETAPPVNTMGGHAVVHVNNNEYINLKISDSEATTGERVCVDVVATSFTNVMSMQYTIEWDPSLLQFAALGKFQLKDLTTNNFGAHMATQGKLTFSWFDQALQSVSVPDGTSIYQLCFEAIGAAGSSTQIVFSEMPVPFEISNKVGDIIRFDHQPATIRITN